MPLLPGHMRSRMRRKQISSMLMSLNNGGYEEGVLGCFEFSLTSIHPDLCVELLLFSVKAYCAKWDIFFERGRACGNFTSILKDIESISLQLAQLLRSTEIKFLDFNGFRSLVWCLHDILNISTVGTESRTVNMQLKQLHLNLLLDLLDSIYFVANNSFKYKDLRSFFAENCISLVSKSYGSLKNILLPSQIVLIEEKMSLCMKLLLFDDHFANDILRDINRIITAAYCGENEYPTIKLPIFDSIINIIAGMKGDLEILKGITFILRNFISSSIDIMESDLSCYPKLHSNLMAKKDQTLSWELHRFEQNRISWRVIQVFPA